MQRLIDADALAELFRDMAEFAHLEEARKVLLIAAETVEAQPEVMIPEAELQETAGEPGQGEQEPFRWDVKHGYYGRYLACPLCGYETRDDRQPEREGWSRCPGCGNKCSGGGTTIERPEETEGAQEGGSGEGADAVQESRGVQRSDARPGDAES